MKENPASEYEVFEAKSWNKGLEVFEVTRSDEIHDKESKDRRYQVVKSETIRCECSNSIIPICKKGYFEAPIAASSCEETYYYDFDYTKEGGSREQDPAVLRVDFIGESAEAKPPRIEITWTRPDGKTWLYRYWEIASDPRKVQMAFTPDEQHFVLATNYGVFIIDCAKMKGGKLLEAPEVRRVDHLDASGGTASNATSFMIFNTSGSSV